ncbi:MAG: hypothetical protein AB8C46_13275 [Burkholderiaceae bacterium]
MKTQTNASDVSRSLGQRLMPALWVLAAALTPLAANAENHSAGAEQKRATAMTMPGWQVIEHQGGQAVEVTRKSAGGSVSTVCAGGQCNVFVEPVSQCTPQAQYPILLNSPKQVGVISGVCRLLSSEKGTRQVVHLTDREAVFAAMLTGEDLSLAFPTTEGAVDVIEVVMDGLRPLLSEAIGRQTSNRDSSDRETQGNQGDELVDWAIGQTETRDLI